MLIRQQAHLAAAIGSAHPWALNRDPPAAKGHLTRLVAVTDRTALQVVATPRTDNLDDLFFQKLREHPKPNPDR